MADESAVEVQCAATVLLGRNNLSSWLVFETQTLNTPHRNESGQECDFGLAGGQIERLDFTVHIAHRRWTLFMHPGTCMDPYTTHVVYLFGTFHTQDQTQ